MSVYSKFLHLLNGAARTVDLSTNTLGVSAIQFDGSTSGNVTLNAAAVTSSYSLALPSAQGSALSVLQNDGSGNLSWASIASSPSIINNLVAGQSFSANTSYLVRWGMHSLSETASDVYAADDGVVSFDEFWAIGIALSPTAVTSGDSIPVQSYGIFTLGSSDTPFSSSDVGNPVWLTTAGAFSTTAPTGVSTAAFKIGIVMSTTQIWVDSQMMGTNNTAGTPGSGPLSPDQGGTGLDTLTPYALLAGGTTSTGILQQISGLGSTGYVLTSNGASALPTWQAPLTLTAESANTIYAGPVSGPMDIPAFRSLVGADLPNPSSSTLGGVKSAASVSHQWIDSISTSGVPHLSQPAFSDISGTVSAAQLPNPSATTLGGIESYAAVTSQWINAISTSGVPSSTQPAFTDISGSVAASQLPNPSATTLGGIRSAANVSHQWISSISTSGIPALSQPAFTDVSGTATIAQGGTGQVTAAAAFSALSPITTTGDIIYSSSGTTASRLAIGSTGNVLTVSGGVPIWAAPATSGTVTSVSVTPANGLAGTVLNPTSTPAITLSTTISGILSGNGSAISAAPTTGSGSVVLATSPTLVTPLLGTPTSGNLSNCTNFPATSLSGAISSTQVTTNTFLTRTVQVFTTVTGAGTYNLPTSPRKPRYLEVEVVGPGGGGQGGGTSPGAGGTSTATTFGTSLLSAGAGGGASTTGGAGGTNSLGGQPGDQVNGGNGAPAINASGLLQAAGGQGGSSYFGGAGNGSSGFGAAAGVGQPNSGGGGGGGSGSSTGAGGAGGGAGGWLKAIIDAPSNSYSFVLTDGGSAGSAGTGTSAGAGAKGSAGKIIVWEYYQ